MSYKILRLVAVFRHVSFILDTEETRNIFMNYIIAIMCDNYIQRYTQTHRREPETNIIFLHS